MKLPRHERPVQRRKRKGDQKRKRQYSLSSLKPVVGDSGGEAKTGGAESGGVQSSSPPLSGSPF